MHTAGAVSQRVRRGLQECSCFSEQPIDGSAAGAVREAVRLQTPGAPIFSLALDPAGASSGRQQVCPKSGFAACQMKKILSSVNAFRSAACPERAAECRF